ncbi:hypothetical protein P308_32095 [Pseudomonas piscis]|nr:hypothetical protein P308_32095 [Pseudomonas piscis]
MIDVGGGLDRQRGVALQQPLDGLERNARGGPWRGIARRYLAGVGEAGFHGNGRLTVHHGHFESGLSQIIGTGGSDNATAQDQNAHFHILIALTAAGCYSKQRCAQCKKHQAVIFTI